MLRRPFARRQLSLDVLRSLLHQLLFLEGERLIHERFLLRRLVKQNMSAVDVGANIGYYTLLLRDMVGPNGRVLAIEPSVENFSELRRNVEQNGLTNVEIVCCAVGSQSTQIGFTSGINGRITDQSGADHLVEMRPLDSLISHPVDFIKIDVEGYEQRALEGSRNVLAAHRPILLLEFHPHYIARYGGSLQDVLAILSPIYSSIEFFDVPLRLPFHERFAVRYFQRDCLRRISLESAQDPVRECERVFGTFWILCRPQADSITR